MKQISTMHRSTTKVPTKNRKQNISITFTTKAAFTFRKCTLNYNFYHQDKNTVHALSVKVAKGLKGRVTFLSKQLELIGQEWWTNFYLN